VPRLILTGILAFALSAGIFGIATADETAAPQPATVTAPAGSNATTTERAALPADDADTAPPTAGADVAMWNGGHAIDAPTSSQPAQLSQHISRLRRFASGIVSRSSALASSLTRSAMRFIGTPYVFGGTHTSGFDCSGYVQHVFALLGVHLPRTADAQYDAGRRIAAAMAPGDLVFFHTYAPGVSHVGIYLGNNRFIHSSSSHGVAISSLHDAYWAPRYVGAKRVFSGS